MSKNTLDKAKPFGHIFGDSQGRHFEQDDRFFGSDGKLWRDPSKKLTAEERKAIEDEAAAEAAAAKAEEERLAAEAAGGPDSQLSAQLTTQNISGGAA